MLRSTYLPYSRSDMSERAIGKTASSVFAATEAACQALALARTAMQAVQNDNAHRRAPQMSPLLQALALFATLLSAAVASTSVVHDSLHEDYTLCLPNELLAHIFSFCNPRSLVVCQRVCTRWRPIIVEQFAESIMWLAYGSLRCWSEAILFPDMASLDFDDEGSFMSSSEHNKVVIAYNHHNVSKLAIIDTVTGETTTSLHKDAKVIVLGDWIVTINKKENTAVVSSLNADAFPITLPAPPTSTFAISRQMHVHGGSSSRCLIFSFPALAANNCLLIDMVARCVSEHAFDWVASPSHEACVFNNYLYHADVHAAGLSIFKVQLDTGLSSSVGVISSAKCTTTPNIHVLSTKAIILHGVDMFGRFDVAKGVYTSWSFSRQNIPSDIVARGNRVAGVKGNNLYIFDATTGHGIGCVDFSKNSHPSYWLSGNCNYPFLFGINDCHQLAVGVDQHIIIFQLTNEKCAPLLRLAQRGDNLDDETLPQYMVKIMRKEQKEFFSCSTERGSKPSCTK